MSQKYRRYSLKSKNVKSILSEVSERLKVNVEALFGSKANVEVVEADFGQIYLVNGKPLFFNVDGKTLPTLLFQEFTGQAPKVVVDMGAVPYVCKGADVMAPGIVRVEGNFSKGDVVLVVDEKYGKALAIGESLYDAEAARSAKQGAVVKNLHFVSDKIWNLAKTLAEH
ncbi:MAG: RNA-binding protein [Candidatus Bathyarchaeia archaeon]